MKILWLHQYFATPQGWGAVRTYEFARRWVEAGHEVDIVCCAGYDATLAPAGRKPLVIDGMRVLVSGTQYRQQMGFWRRLVSFARFMLQGAWFVVRHGRKYDCVIASSGPLSLAVPALMAHYLWRVPYVFEVIDVWPASAIAAGVLRNPVWQWLSLRLEYWTYRKAALIVTCSNGMSARVMQNAQSASRALGVANAHRLPPTLNAQPHFTAGVINYKHGAVPVITIPNCCDLAQFECSAARRRQLRERFGVQEDQLVVLYSGAMGVSNAMDDVAAAMAATQDAPNIIWWFAGSGACQHLVQGGEHSVFWGCLARQEVVELCLAADINVVTFKHESLFYENSPNKFFDGIAAGLPALFNRPTWLEPWIKQYDCGIVCSGGVWAATEMATALKALAKDAPRRQAMSLGARRLATACFSRAAWAQEYKQVVRSMLDARSAAQKPRQQS